MLRMERVALPLALLCSPCSCGEIAKVFVKEALSSTGE